VSDPIVAPSKAGVQGSQVQNPRRSWVPAFAGMTSFARKGLI